MPLSRPRSPAAVGTLDQTGQQGEQAVVSVRAMGRLLRPLRTGTGTRWSCLFECDRTAVQLEGCPLCLVASVGRTRPSTRSRLRIVIDPDRTIAEVARELGIDAGMLSVWVKDERRRIAAAKVHGEKPLETAERAEPPRLRRHVAELEKDNAFLVKPRRTCVLNTSGPPHSGGPEVCCARDGGRPSAVSRAGGCKPPRAASVKSRGGERRGKTSQRARQVRAAKASETEPLWKHRNA